MTNGYILRAVHVHLEPPLSPARVLLPRRWLLIALGVALGLLAVAAALRNGQILLTWDEPIQKGVEANRTGTLDTFFRTMSRFGSTIPVLVLGGLAALITWRRCSAVAMAIVAATLSRPLIEFTLKVLVDRERPDFERMVNGTGPSFPSGHVLAAVALWGMLPLVVAVYTRRRWIWWASVGVAAFLIVGITASRVYLGVHWFSDVTGGLVVGTFFLLGVESLFLRAHTRYPCGMCPEESGSDSTSGGTPVEAVDPVGAAVVEKPVEQPVLVPEVV